jgi:hypothetical protein
MKLKFEDSTSVEDSTSASFGEFGIKKCKWTALIKLFTAVNFAPYEASHLHPSLIFAFLYIWTPQGAPLRQAPA